MRKFLVIFLASIIICIDAGGQWYIFPGSGGKQDKEPAGIEERSSDDAMNLSIILPLNACGEEVSSNFLRCIAGL